MPFCWEEDTGAEAGGIVLAVDASRHARRVGLHGSTFVSRGLWVRCVGAGPGQEERLLATLAAAGREMLSPTKASHDGTAALFALRTDGTGPEVEVVSIVDAARNTLTLMLWREFTRRVADSPLRVRVVAEDDIRPRA